MRTVGASLAFSPVFCFILAAAASESIKKDDFFAGAGDETEREDTMMRKVAGAFGDNFFGGGVSVSVNLTTFEDACTVDSRPLPSTLVVLSLSLDGEPMDEGGGVGIFAQVFCGAMKVGRSHYEDERTVLTCGCSLNSAIKVYEHARGFLER